MADADDTVPFTHAWIESRCSQISQVFLSFHESISNSTIRVVLIGQRTGPSEPAESSYCGGKIDARQNDSHKEGEHRFGSSTLSNRSWRGSSCVSSSGVYGGLFGVFPQLSMFGETVASCVLVRMGCDNHHRIPQIILLSFLNHSQSWSPYLFPLWVNVKGAFECIRRRFLCAIYCFWQQRSHIRHPSSALLLFWGLIDWFLLIDLGIFSSIRHPWQLLQSR